jgi:type I restriction enzyme S subunit
MSYERCLSLEIPLPPLSEQKRIADILDKADTIRRKRQEAIGTLQSCKVAAFHEIFGDPLLNSRNWDRAPLGELLESIESGISPRCLDRPVSGGEWGILKLGAVTWCEYDWTDNKALPETINPDPSIEVQQGDLLFTRKNTHELVAATAFVYQTPPRLMFPDLIFRLRLKTNAPAFPEYLWGLLTYPSKRRQVQSLAGGAAGSMPNISKSRLLQQSVEVPPKNLQESYVKFLHQLHKTRQTTDTSHMSCVDLFHSLVQRAFNGEL